MTTPNKAWSGWARVWRNFMVLRGGGSGSLCPPLTQAVRWLPCYPFTTKYKTLVSNSITTHIFCSRAKRNTCANFRRVKSLSFCWLVCVKKLISAWLWLLHLELNATVITIFPKMAYGLGVSMTLPVKIIMLVRHAT